MKRLYLFLFVALGGCVLMANVKTVGDNKYILSGQSSSRAYEVEGDVMAKAESFCQQKKTHVNVLSKEDNQTFNGWVPHAVSITFSCN